MLSESDLKDVFLETINKKWPNSIESDLSNYEEWGPFEGIEEEKYKGLKCIKRTLKLPRDVALDKERIDYYTEHIEHMQNKVQFYSVKIIPSECEIWIVFKFLWK